MRDCIECIAILFLLKYIVRFLRRSFSNYSLCAIHSLERMSVVEFFVRAHEIQTSRGTSNNQMSYEYPCMGLVILIHTHTHKDTVHRAIGKTEKSINENEICVTYIGQRLLYHGRCRRKRRRRHPHR